VENKVAQNSLLTQEKKPQNKIRQKKYFGKFYKIGKSYLGYSNDENCDFFKLSISVNRQKLTYSKVTPPKV
jgi:hypothetical protein